MARGASRPRFNGTVNQPCARTLKALRHPLFGLLALGFIFLSLTRLPSGPGSPSVVGALLPGVRNTHCYVGPTLLVVRDERMHLISVDRDSWDPVEKVVGERPQDAKWLLLRPWTRESGFWAPTRRTQTIVMHLSDTAANSPAWTDAENAAATAEAAKWIASPAGWGDRAAAAALMGDGVLEDRILWRGVLLDAGTFLAFVVLFWSASGSRAFIRRRRVKDHLARGVCPECRYNLRAIQGEHVVRCPECGRDWPVWNAQGMTGV